MSYHLNYSVQLLKLTHTCAYHILRPFHQIILAILTSDTFCHNHNDLQLLYSTNLFTLSCTATGHATLLHVDPMSAKPITLHTWAISTSPNDSKYSRNCCSVVFHGNPRTIRSEHFNFVSMRFVFAVEFSKWSSDLRLFSAKKWNQCMTHGI